MAWIDPNPSRIPTVVELSENKLRIKKLDDRIMQLTEELEKCRNERDGRRHFIAPFRRLPHELLCEIASHRSITFDTEPCLRVIKEGTQLHEESLDKNRAQSQMVKITTV